MNTTKTIPAVLAGALALGACAARPPAGPTVLAVPGENRNYDQFRQDEANCRTQAQAGLGFAQPATGAPAVAPAGTSTYGLQRQYDVTYAQCIVGSGNRIETAAALGIAPAYPYAYSAYGYGYPYYGSPYYGGLYTPWFGPSVSLGFGFGFGRGYYGGYNRFYGGPRFGGYYGGFRGGFRGRR